MTVLSHRNPWARATWSTTRPTSCASATFAFEATAGNRNGRARWVVHAVPVTEHRVPEGAAQARVLQRARVRGLRLAHRDGDAGPPGREVGG